MFLWIGGDGLGECLILLSKVVNNCHRFLKIVITCRKELTVIQMYTTYCDSESLKILTAAIFLGNKFGGLNIPRTKHDWSKHERWKRARSKRELSNYADTSESLSVGP